MNLTPAWLRRAIVEPAWASVTRASLREHWHELERTQFLSESELRDRQRERLRKVSAAACRDTVFYARRFADAGVGTELRSLEDLQKLPILTKRDVRAHARELLSVRSSGQNILEFRTGGSTGVPLTLLIAEEISHQRNAAARRSNRWTGWRVGEPVGAVWGNPKLPDTIKERLRDELLEPTVYLDTMTMSPNAVRAFARAWRRKGATLLFGHAHSLYLLAQMTRDLGIDDFRPRAIIATSMMLLPHERRVIDDVFGVHVFDRDGCEEVGLVGCECERHTGLHINIDHLIVEFIREDGRPAAPGERAFVVVTDLINDTMPMLRYRVEDLAAPLAEPCGCGRGLPLMGHVAGRTADFLVRADGTRVAGVSLIENTLTKFDGIEQMQIVQEELQRIVLRIVAPRGGYADPRTALRDYFGTAFPGARIDIEDVNTIAREPNGKYRFSICRVRPEQGADALA
jgi:phenylacetate-CoA ligase